MFQVCFLKYNCQTPGYLFLNFGGEMMDKKYTRLWSLSLITISVITVIWAVCNLVNIELPDVIVRIMGVLDICAIPVLVYTSIKKRDK